MQKPGKQKGTLGVKGEEDLESKIVGHGHMKCVMGKIEGTQAGRGDNAKGAGGRRDNNIRGILKSYREIYFL